jgi:hypothetical protein
MTVFLQTKLGRAEVGLPGSGNRLLYMRARCVPPGGPRRDRGSVINALPLDPRGKGMKLREQVA